MEFDLISGVVKSTSGLVDAIGSAIDKNVTSDEERLKLRNDLESIVSGLEVTIQKEASARHAADMMSDSWLSKNIRPMILIAVPLIYVMFAILDGYGIIILKSDFSSGIISICQTVFGFYFGGRSLEKASSMFSAKKS